MGKIKILHVIDHLNAGGAQEIVLDLARGLNRTEFELHVWCLHGYGSYFSELESLGIPVKSLSPGKFNPFIFFKFWQCLRGERFDVLNLHLSFSIFMGGFLGRVTHVPQVVATIHALKNHSLPWVFPLMGMLSALYDRFVAEVEHSVGELRSVGVPAEKIVLIPLGTEKASLASDSFEENLSVDHWAVDGKNPILLNIARLHQHKGQLYLIRAMKEVIRECPSAKLLIIGNGPLEHSLQKAIRELGLEESVFLLGFRRDLAALYTNCDVFVMPSIREGLGIVIIQAMAYKRAVIASDVGAIPEAVQPDRTGVLVPPRDSSALARAIIALLRDPEERKRLGEQAQAFVATHFCLETMIQRYAVLYRDLVNHPS